MSKRNFSYLPSGQKLDRWVDASRDSVSRVSSSVEDPAGVEGDPLVIVVVLLLELCLEFRFKNFFLNFFLMKPRVPAPVVKGTWEC